MIPATIPNVTPRVMPFRNGISSRKPTRAPIGSARPERKDQRTALPRDPVACRMGTATATPSGMLWMAMARATGMATEGSFRPAMNVAKPSGKLWMAIATAVMVPARISRRRSSEASGSSTEWGSCGLMALGTSRSITPITSIPPKNAATAHQPAGPAPTSSPIDSTALGRISTRET